MGFWSKIKKEVSRVGRKAGFDRSSKAWGTMATGAISGAITGAFVGGPWGALAGAGIGAAGGMVAGDQLDNMDKAADAAADADKKALELASRTELELSENNAEETPALEDERRARLAAKYSLSKTSSFAKKSTASSGRKTIG
ncbi:MAG: hypothetical protein E7037_02400 [Verrucomicrobia bacterium]|nr:hypothetical protein [Verrucomicrobiota bacterium]